MMIYDWQSVIHIELDYVDITSYVVWVKHI